MTTNDEDSLLAIYIATARQHVEADTARALITQTWDWKMDSFPFRWPVEVLRAPLSSVTSVKYLDSDNSEQTWAAANYRVTAPSGTHAEPGTIGLAYGVTLPTVYPVDHAVTIRFVAGYGASGSSVPAALRAAILLLIGEMYERRTESIVGTTSTQVEFSVDALLSPFRVQRWGLLV